MDHGIALFTTQGGEFLLRWVHYLAGVLWIGLLYYFNFVQVPFFAETDAAVRNGAILKLVPRALGYFRWGAMLTFLSGLAIMLLKISVGGGAMMKTSWGVAISIGTLLGTLMFLNVWLVIWPNQRIVIASTAAVAGGGQPDPRAAAAGARAFVASRTNALCSFPMLFFMGAASHLTLFGTARRSPGMPMGIITLIVLLLQANVLFGKRGQGFNVMLEKLVAVIHIGLVLALLFYFILTLSL